MVETFIAVKEGGRAWAASMIGGYGVGFKNLKEEFHTLTIS